MTQIKRISTDSIRDFLLNPPYPRSIISLTLKTIPILLNLLLRDELLDFFAIEVSGFGEAFQAHGHDTGIGGLI